ncbi:MAG TPA: pentapeptide repeat-containing protein [Candidatus Nitrosotalea sp.]|nr:pentapeptide repeat-containing protein [Candidatus Nitrosotalea sp.]
MNIFNTKLLTFKKLLVIMTVLTIFATVNISAANAQTVDTLRCSNMTPYADLHGCDFEAGSLVGVNLFHANLSGANLSGADLSNANLSYADLTHSKISYANLFGTNLSGANLTGADLINANFGGAITNDVTPSTLSGCINNSICS